jgi:hypothetical protein
MGVRNVIMVGLVLVNLMNEVVQSVNIMIGILMGGVSWSIYYIMRMAYLEMKEDGRSGT